MWCVVGALAAMILPSGNDGGGAMASFFYLGGTVGAISAIGGAVLVWKLLADASRMGTIGGSLVGLLVVLIIGIVIAMQPNRVERDDFPPGKRGEFQLEADLPAAMVDSLPKQAALTFQLRSGDGTLEGPSQKQNIRREGDRVIVPGAVAVKEVRHWIVAIMNGDQQIDTGDVGPEPFSGNVEEYTQWSAWSPTRTGLQVRWRVAVLPR
jgi:hypothetical protein